MYTIQSGLRRLALLGLSNVVVKPFWFLFIVALCPRVLGVEEYGRMQTALAFATLVFSLTDLGLSNFTLREVSRSPAEGGRYFHHVLAYRVAVLGLAWAAVSLVGWKVGGSDQASTFVAAGAFALGATLTLSVSMFYRAYERWDAEAIAVGAERTMTVVAGGAALFWTRSAAGALAGMALASVVALLVQGVWIRRTLLPAHPESTRAGGSIDTRFIRSMVWRALPLGIADLLIVLYLKVDQVMVSGFLGDAAAGQYAQAYRILELLSLLPVLVVQSYAFPRLSSLDASGKTVEFKALVRKLGVGLAISATVLAIGVSVAAPTLIRLLTGDPSFDPSGQVLRVLVWTFPFTCVKDLLYVSNLARRNHASSIAIFTTAVVLNVMLNAVLLRPLGITGAALATVAAEVVVVILYMGLRSRGRNC